jgi:hypothetical protein
MCVGGLLFIFVTILGSILGGVGPIGVFGGEEEEGGVRSRPGAARTILRFHTISARPTKQPLMVRTFLQVYGARLLFRHAILAESQPALKVSFNRPRPSLSLPGPSLKNLRSTILECNRSEVG